MRRWTIAHLLFATLAAAIVLAVGRDIPWAAFWPDDAWAWTRDASCVAMSLGLAWVGVGTAVAFWLGPRGALPWLVLGGGALGAALGVPAVYACGRSWWTCVCEWSLTSCGFATLGMAVFAAPGWLWWVISPTSELDPPRVPP